MTLILWLAVAALAFIAGRRGGTSALIQASGFAVRSGMSILPVLVLALLAASFLAQLVPSEAIGRLIGGTSGFAGILIASAVGGFIPGGPMVSFPIAVFLWELGAGLPQMVALLSAWSVIAVHRMLAFETPLMGWRFSAQRLMAVAIVPPLSGVAAAGLVALLGDLVAFAPPG